jgi:putative MFS transporter
VLISATFWGQAIGAPLSGIVAEKWGRRRVLLLSCAIMGLTAILAGIAQDLNQLIAARAIQGLGVGAEVPIAGAMFNEFVRSKHRGGVVFAYQLMFTWGGIVAPWLALLFIALFGQSVAWRAMFLFAAAPVLMAFARNRLLPESPRWLLNNGRVAEAEKVVESFEASARAAGQDLPAPVAVPEPRLEKTNFLELFQREYRGRTVMLVVWIAMAYAYGYGYAPFVATLYTRVGGLPITDAIWLTVASQAISLVFQYVVSLTLDRFGRRFYFGWGLLYAAVVLVSGAIVVGLFHQTSWQVLFALTILVGFGTTSQAGFYVYAPELFPTRMRAWGTSVGSTAIRLVSSFMPIVVGLVATSTFGLGGVYVIMAVFLAIGGLTIVLFGPETRRRVLEEIAR